MEKYSKFILIKLIRSISQLIESLSIHILRVFLFPSLQENHEIETNF